MAKMKAVCHETGLTEKTVRLYVKKGLLSPHTEEGLYRTSYDFSETDIRQLKDIAVLRRAGFSINEIDQLQRHPESLPGMIEEKKTLLEAEIYEKQALQSALGRMSVEEQGSVSAFSRGLGPVTDSIERQEAPPKRHPRMFHLFLTIVLFGVLLGRLAMQGAHLALAAVIFAALTGAVVCLVMAARYLYVSLRVTSMPVWGKGQVVSMIQEPGIDAAYARAGMSAPGFSEPGRGGIWLVPMLLWGELRPDNWYPLIHGHFGNEEDNEKPTMITIAYGAFRRSWTEGQELTLARDPRRPDRFLPAESRWLHQKALLYLLIAMGLGVLDWGFVLLFIRFY